ncbi:MAG: XdhC family protein [Desulfomonile tiedjei]|nr:XdhC family protein [Desulfomonile tiedjei]
MKKIVHAICSLLEQGEGFAMATILTHVGSTPRTAGTKMLISSDGRSIGTIGGGLVEAEVQKAAAEVIETTESRIRAFDLTGANAERTDLICGGALEVLIEYVAASPSNALIFRRLLTALEDRSKSYLVKILGPAMQDELDPIQTCLVLEDESVYGDFSCPTRWIDTIAKAAGGERYPVMLAIENQRVLVEPFFFPGTVYLFGAGHVSQQVASLAGLVDFRTVVFDDRSEFANRERFPAADKVEVIPNFDDALDGLALDSDSYVVIVTRGHRHDQTVLQQVLKTDAGYIGMIGSRKKRARLYDSLLSQGFTNRDLERIHSPIGLNIGAETPEEIGVSIVAELIQARSERGPL